MHDFDFQAPLTLDSALALLAESNGQARPLAGGTDLIDQMRLGRYKPNLLIDLKKIPELNALAVDASGLRLGAAVPCYRIYGNAEIVKKYSALADSCHIIGGIQIQSRASVGGNLCNSGPAADSTPGLIALDAMCLIASQAGTREVPAEEFCTGPGLNVLKPGEILLELRFPAPKPNSGSHYRRFIPRNEMDIAVVGVGASVELNDAKDTILSARIALGAVAPTPLFAKKASELLAGQKISDDLIAKAANAAKEIINPITDMRGTVEYRQHITGVLTERVLKAAIARARGEEIHYLPGR
jgi:carbon-monoxide dehydrogenase medium subunit